MAVALLAAQFKSAWRCHGADSPTVRAYRTIISQCWWITRLLCLTITGWLTAGYPKIDGALVSLTALCVLKNSGVLGWGLIKKGVDLAMLIYMGVWA